MQKLIGGFLALLVMVGVAWGVAQYVGDGADFLSPEWFSHWTEKLHAFQEETSEKIAESLPNPDEQG